MRKTVFVCVVAAAIGTFACERAAAPAAPKQTQPVVVASAPAPAPPVDQVLCNRGPTEDSVKAASDPTYEVAGMREYAITSACVRQMSFELAASTDPAETVARAAVDSCSGEIATEAMEQNRGPFRGPPLSEWVSSDETEMTHAALAAVVSARAGHCSGPVASPSKVK